MAFLPEVPFFEIFFHSVSSFCNAGFTLFPHEFVFFSNNYPVLIITAILITLGGLGFIPMYEIVTAPFSNRRKSFSLHTKIALISTVLIAAVGTICFLTIQYSSLSINSFINSLFNAISIRSAGFLTIPIEAVYIPIFLLIMIVTFIGSAPGSTGSGIKTTSFFIAYAAAKAVILGKKNVHLLSREISNIQVQKVLVIFVLSISWIATATFMLLISDGLEFLPTMFTIVSSFCNLGLTIGVSTKLSIFGKIISSLSMIIGRIGPITLALVFLSSKETKTINYPEEKLMLS